MHPEPYKEYHINEFSVSSEIVLPYDSEARSTIPIPKNNQTVLRRASLANIPSLLRKLRPQMAYDVGDEILIEPKNTALHIDLPARTFTIDCLDENLAMSASWAFHAGIGVATMTRGGLPLHGAGLEIAGKYVALMADSGSGKSTLSWFLVMRGALFGNDDLIPVYLRGESVTAYPSVSMFPKLQREAVNRHGLDHTILPPADYGTDEEEYYVPLASQQRIVAPSPLSGVFLLRPQPLTSSGLLQAQRIHEVVRVDRLPEDDAAMTLWNNMHALWLIGKWVDQERIVSLCRGIAERVPVWTISYPKAYALLPHIADAINRILEVK